MMASNGTVFEAHIEHDIHANLSSMYSSSAEAGACASTNKCRYQIDYRQTITGTLMGKQWLVMTLCATLCG